jgi:hypothetical protein
VPEHDHAVIVLHVLVHADAALPRQGQAVAPGNERGERMSDEQFKVHIRYLQCLVAGTAFQVGLLLWLTFEYLP